jgi:KDO2-lipid IV(A) lauroyltransferase
VIFLKLLSRLPLRALYAMTDIVYVIIYHIWRFRRTLSLTNVRNSFPDKPAAEVEEIAAQSYRNACNLIAEVLKGASIDADELRRRVEIKNLALLEPWIRAEQPVVLLASHHCNWEWLLQTSCIELGISVDAVYKPLRVGAVDRFMLAARSRFGGNPIPVRNFLMEVMKRRKGARIIALVADQTPLASEEKHWTRFLSQETAFFVGADKIARMLRAPVFFVGMHRTRRGHYQAVLQLLSVPPYEREGADIIERYARVAEAHIEKYPADWLWMYRKWKYKKPLYA